MTEKEAACTHLPLSNYSLQLHGIINLLSRYMLTIKSFSYLVVGVVVRKYTDEGMHIKRKKPNRERGSSKIKGSWKY